MKKWASGGQAKGAVDEVTQASIDAKIRDIQAQHGHHAVFFAKNELKFILDAITNGTDVASLDEAMSEFGRLPQKKVERA